VGGKGVRRVLCLPLSDAEKTGFQHSAEQVWDVQKGVWDKI
jgi:malate/lactate dehydrogenase